MALPRGELPAGGRDDPFAGRVNQAAALEYRQKARRSQQAEARMLPAQQRFEADQASARDVDARLVVQHELVAHQRMSQADFELLALCELGVERPRVILEAIAAAFLRFVHRDVGGLDQALRGVAGVRIHGDADARRCVHFAVAELVFLRQHQQQFLCRRCRVAGLAEIFEANDELVTTPAAGKIADAQVLVETPGDIAQQRVADVVTQRIVDRLEAIEIDEKHRQRRRLALAAPDGARQLLGKQCAIGEPGQLVELRALFEFDACAPLVR